MCTMIPRQLFRSIHTNHFLCDVATKSLLGELRKKTGYAFSNCKKALELHNNDIIKAEQWLKEQAQNQGWTKAQKLQSRETAQGLVAMITDNNYGALVEINCETDFVARNVKFHELAETILATVLKQGKTLEQNSLVNKTILCSESINELCAKDGKTLADHSALAIGFMGENIKIKRALCMGVQPGVHIYGCTHPTPLNPVPSSFGRYGALVALKSQKQDATLGMQLCQHIIGMNPVKVGDPKVDLPCDNIENESVLLYQEFLFDSTLSIQKLLEEEKTEILDFARFEMGEDIENKTKESLDAVETCG